MTLPFFYITDYTNQTQLLLDEDTSRHVVQVLRMKERERLNLTNGKGNLLTCEITEAHKKHCAVEVKEIQNQKPKVKNISIGISLLKNPSRFEWFLEKATEIGVSEIIPLICDRTEKEKFRYDRMQGIVISAMLQSQQCWLPVLQEPTYFENVIADSSAELKLIAHCVDSRKKELSLGFNNTANNTLILIGPEGDFSAKEIEKAFLANFQPVSLGETRLRTETAGIAAAVMLVL